MNVDILYFILSFFFILLLFNQKLLIKNVIKLHIKQTEDLPKMNSFSKLPSETVIIYLINGKEGGARLFYN